MLPLYPINIASKMLNLIFTGKNENGKYHHLQQQQQQQQHQSQQKHHRHSVPVLSLLFPQNVTARDGVDGVRDGSIKIDEKTPLLPIYKPLTPPLPPPVMPSSIHKLHLMGMEKHGGGTRTVKNRENIRFGFYVLFYCFYLVAGGLLFRFTESPAEIEFRHRLQATKGSFMEKYPNIKDDDLENLIIEITRANERGISALRNASSEFNWSFGQALFFSSTVITTIGYGHVTPLSQTGKLFCILYAMIGIPLTLVLLSAMVERLLTPAIWLLGVLNSKLGHLYQPFNIRLLHLSIIVFIYASLFFAIPTFVFAYLEPTWDFLDAFYYCFISLTTIGLGDYIPGDSMEQPNRALYKILTTIYLILGLIGMMLILTVFYEIPQLNLGQLFTETNASENEKLRLSGGSGPRCYSGPSGLYIPQRDEEVRRAVVRIRPRGEDSPSPEDTTPMHARDIRVP